MATYILSPDLTRSMAKKPIRYTKLLKAANRNRLRLWTNAASLVESARHGIPVNRFPKIVGIDPVTIIEWNDSTAKDVFVQTTLAAAKRIKADAIIVKEPPTHDTCAGCGYPTMTAKEALAERPLDGVPMFDFKAPLPQFYAPIMNSLNDTFANTAYVCGAKVKAFEKSFAKATHTKHCFGVSSGTDALHLALLAIGIQPGDEVITSPFTFFATIEAIEHCQAKTVFVDIDRKTFTLDPRKLRKAITPRTKAIIPVHLYGQAADMSAIMKIANEHKIPVIEDCAQAHLATGNGTTVGGIGAIGCFSFYPTKNLGAWGEAGAVTTNNPDLAKRMEWIRNHGQHEKYLHAVVGHNYRMEEVQAAVLTEKLKYLEPWTTQRDKLARRYSRKLKKIPGIKVPFVRKPDRHVWHLYTIRTERRDELMNFLTAKKIGCAIHYAMPLHLQPAWADRGYHEGDFPESERVSREVLSLPLFAEMTLTQQNRVIDVIREFFKVKA